MCHKLQLQKHQLSCLKPLVTDQVAYHLEVKEVETSSLKVNIRCGLLTIMSELKNSSVEVMLGSKIWSVEEGLQLLAMQVNVQRPSRTLSSFAEHQVLCLIDFQCLLCLSFLRVGAVGETYLLYLWWMMQAGH